MPYHWTTPENLPADHRIELDLWPYRSLPKTGFVWVIGLTAGALSLPLLAVLGNRVLWGMLPFMVLVVWALWFGIQRSYRSGSSHEHLVLTPDRLTITRQDPGRSDRVWQTNPYWLRVRLRQDGPVADYLTITDGQREIELGGFLSPEERISLRDELTEAIARMRQAPATGRPAIISPSGDL